MLFGSLVVLTLLTLNWAIDPEVEHLAAEVASLRQQFEGKFLNLQFNFVDQKYAVVNKWIKEVIK